MNWYPWLNEPYRQIIANYQSGRGHHALLLHSLPGNGMMHFAMVLVVGLFAKIVKG